MAWRILEGSVFDTLPTIEPGSIDVAVTSPPYWQLRSYLPKGHALKPLELGSEPTPEQYIENQVRVFRLVRDALADHGVCWLNIGDTYNSGTTAPAPASTGTDVGRWNRPGEGRNRAKAESEPGNLCLIPQRLALALQADGWIVRSVIVWHKPAPMPASVSGWAWRRCRKANYVAQRNQSKVAGIDDGRRQVPNGRPANKELTTYENCPGCKRCQKTGGYVLRRGSWRPTSAWEPILMLAKTADYFCDGAAVKQPAAAATVQRDRYTRIIDDPDEQFAVRHDHETVCDGANLRDVWTIAAEPLKEKHYAAFPTELVFRCLAAATSAKGYCPACGKPWCRVVETPTAPDHVFTNTKKPLDGYVSVNVRGKGQGQKYQEWRNENPPVTLDWRPTCQCPEQPPRPGRVLDPFCGSGRTGLAAQQLGLDFTGCELNEAYIQMASKLLGNNLFT